MNSNQFDPGSSVSEIVMRDYRTARVFRKYGIEFCCGGKFPLEMICKSQGLDTVNLLNELQHATRDVKLSSDPGYHEWTTDFLIDYVVNLHHRYVTTHLPPLVEQLEEFIKGHEKKFPDISLLGRQLERLANFLIPHMDHEEETQFPYIRQLSHAYHNREPYALLLVRTLRKPVRRMIENELDKIQYTLGELRQITSGYTPPEKACVTHCVIFYRLKELDDDISQYLYLENNILFPRIMQMEKDVFNEPLL